MFNVKTKRIYVLILIGAIFCISNNINHVNGEYQVSIGEIYQYDIIKAEVNSTFNGHFETGSGYTIDSNHLEENTMVSYEITEVNTLGVFWNLSSGGFSHNHVSDDTIINSYENLLTQCFALPKIYDPIHSDIENGTGLVFYSPFIDPINENWEIIKNVEDYVENTIDLLTDTKITYEMDSLLKESNSKLSIEFVLGGTIDGKWANVPINAKFMNHLLIEFDKINGVFLGLRMKSSIDGSYNSNTVNITISFQSEMKDYNIPSFTKNDITKVSGVFGEGILIGLSSLLILTILVSKRKESR